MALSKECVDPLIIYDSNYRQINPTTGRRNLLATTVKRISWGEATTQVTDAIPLHVFQRQLLMNLSEEHFANTRILMAEHEAQAAEQAEKVMGSEGGNESGWSLWNYEWLERGLTRVSTIGFFVYLGWQHALPAIVARALRKVEEQRRAALGM